MREVCPARCGLTVTNTPRFAQVIVYTCHGTTATIAEVISDTVPN